MSDLKISSPVPLKKFYSKKRFNHKSLLERGRLLIWKSQIKPHGRNCWAAHKSDSCTAFVVQNTTLTSWQLRTTAQWIKGEIWHRARTPAYLRKELLCQPVICNSIKTNYSRKLWAIKHQYTCHTETIKDWELIAFTVTKKKKNLNPLFR